MPNVSVEAVGFNELLISRKSVPVLSLVLDVDEPGHKVAERMKRVVRAVRLSWGPGMPGYVMATLLLHRDAKNSGLDTIVPYRTSSLFFSVAHEDHEMIRDAIESAPQWNLALKFGEGSYGCMYSIGSDGIVTRITDVDRSIMFWAFPAPGSQDAVN